LGAIGDGITDDRRAIQAALNAATPGASVYLPPGTYYLSGPLLIPSNITIRGAGDRSVLKRANASRSFALLVNSDYADNSAGNSNITIRDLSLDSNGALQVPPYNEFLHGIALIGVTHATITNCTFTGLSGDGIYVSSSSDGTPHANYSRDIAVAFNDFQETNHGRNGISLIDADGVEIVGNRFVNLSSPRMPGAIDLEPNISSQRVVGVRIVSNSFVSCQQGVQIHNVVDALVHDITIARNSIEAGPSGGYALYLDNASMLTLIGNTIRAPIAKGVYTSGCSQVVLRSNTFLHSWP